MEYGKYKYEQSKKEHSQRKHTIVTKELKIRPNIDTHDLMVKVKQTKHFLEDGHKVKIIMQFHGREIEYKKAGESVIIDFLAQLEPLYKVDSPLKQDGKNLIVFISAQKKNNYYLIFLAKPKSITLILLDLVTNMFDEFKSRC